MEDFDFATLAQYAEHERWVAHLLAYQARRKSRYAKYDKEHKLFPAAQERKVSNAEAEMIVRKLDRHFKLRGVALQFRGSRQSGRAWSSGLVRISNTPSVGLIAHELAHLLDWRRRVSGKSRGKSRHGSKRWFRLVGRILAYGEKHNWWLEEFEQRATQREETAKKNKERQALVASPDAKLNSVQERIKRWESKRKRAENAIKKLNRTLNRLKKNLKKSEGGEAFPLPAGGDLWAG